MGNGALNRRAFIVTGLSAAGATVFRANASDGPAGLPLSEAEPFSFERLRQMAEELADQPYTPAEIADSDILDAIDYEKHNQIQFRDDLTIWDDEASASAVRFFHPGRYFKEPVRMFLVEDGAAREVGYTPDAFQMPGDNPANDLSERTGFAGFRVMDAEQKGDWLAFLGASYFRTAGPEGQFGLSARGLAVDVAVEDPEEFPRFSHFWLERDEDADIIIYALLEGPSVTGAYRFKNVKQPEGIVQEVEASIFLRNAVSRLGIAPLTSMYWYGKPNRHMARDWRPQIHDSDGLSLWTGSGERIWRPLNNPPRVIVNAFQDDNPRGFGLMQRDREFENYQDDGVFYEKRASLWVEPLGEWGPGAVELLEIPTDDEIHDNIGAFWVPAEAGGPGTRHDIAYRLQWLADEPYPENIARVVATRMGAGGVPGQPRPEGVVKFAVDFEGGDLADSDRDDIEAVVEAGNGEATGEAAYPVVGTTRWRAIFDLEAGGDEPVDLRMHLKSKEDGAIVSETWVYQFFPEQAV